MAMINFDSSDWDSICDTIKKVNEIDELQYGKTSDDEDIIFDVCKDEYGNNCLKTDVFQSDGWIRTNIYNPTWYSIDEFYKKDR